MNKGFPEPTHSSFCVLYPSFPFCLYLFWGKWVKLKWWANTLFTLCVGFFHVPAVCLRCKVSGKRNNYHFMLPKCLVQWYIATYLRHILFLFIFSGYENIQKFACSGEFLRNKHNGNKHDDVYNSNKNNIRLLMGFFHIQLKWIFPLNFSNANFTAFQRELMNLKTHLGLLSEIFHLVSFLVALLQFWIQFLHICLPIHIMKLLSAPENC